MMELRQNQKADVVLLKQELDYCTIGCLLHILCLYRRLHGVEVALEKLLAWRAVRTGVAKCHTHLQRRCDTVTSHE